MDDKVLKFILMQDSVAFLHDKQMAPYIYALFMAKTVQFLVMQGMEGMVMGDFLDVLPPMSEPTGGSELPPPMGFDRMESGFALLIDVLEGKGEVAAVGDALLHRTKQGDQIAEINEGIGGDDEINGSQVLEESGKVSYLGAVVQAGSQFVGLLDDGGAEVDPDECATDVAELRRW